MKSLTTCFYFIEYLLVRIVYCFLGFLPLRLLHAIACGVGTIGYYILPKKRKLALENLRLAFGTEKSTRELRRIARASLNNLIFIYLELIYFSKRRRYLDKYFYLDATSRKYVDHMLAEPKATMYLTGHFGNWEFLALCAGFSGQKMHAIGRPIKNRFIFNYISRLRCVTESSVIDKDYAVKGTLKVFQKKEIVGTLIDQRVGSSGIVVDFFGHPAYTTPFPALMKLKYDCVLHPAFAIRKSVGLFHVEIKDPIKVPLHLAGNEEKIKYMVQEYTKVVEDVVRAYPEQWLWYHRRWRL
jgi:KDO2-lipid IV(A) lauroyltransferase